MNSFWPLKLSQTQKIFLILRWELNPQSSDLRWDALTIELPRLRWQREGCDMSWFVSDIRTPNSAVLICLYISNIKYISSDLQFGKLKENVLATQTFANPENISEPQMGIEPTTFWSPVGHSNHWAIKTQMAERRLRYVLVRKWHTYS